MFKYLKVKAKEGTQEYKKTDKVQDVEFRAFMKGLVQKEVEKAERSESSGSERDNDDDDDEDAESGESEAHKKRKLNTEVRS